MAAKLYLLAVGVALAVFLGGCRKEEGEGPAEKAGRKLDKAAEEAGRQIGKGLEKAGKSLEEAGKRLQEKEKR